MFSPPHFEVTITRAVDAAQLHWPARGEAANEQNLGCNRSYADLRRMSWRDAQEVWTLEAELIARMVAADDPDTEYDAINDELYEHDIGLYGLDLGVASTVIALSAAGAVPFTSCNAGAFGGHHAEWHPVVAFYARPYMVSALLGAAIESAVGLHNSDLGCVIVYADDILRMPEFAAELYTRRGALRPPRTKARSRVDAVENCEPELPFEQKP